MRNVELKLRSIPCKAIRDIESVEDAVRYIRGRIVDSAVECFVGIFLSSSCVVNCYSIISKGDAGCAFISPAEVMKIALLSNSTKMILVHNHPSGVLSPSESDTLVTSRMIESCKIMGLELLDHIIVGGEGYFSFKQRGCINDVSVGLEADYRKVVFA